MSNTQCALPEAGTARLAFKGKVLLQVDDLPCKHTGISQRKHAWMVCVAEAEEARKRCWTLFSAVYR